MITLENADGSRPYRPFAMVGKTPRPVGLAVEVLPLGASTLAPETTAKTVVPTYFKIFELWPRESHPARPYFLPAAPRAVQDFAMSDGALKIGPARMEDLVALDALIEETRLWVQERWPAQWRAPFHHEWLEERIRHEEIFAAHADGELVGTFRLLWGDPDFWTEDDSPHALYVHLLIVRRALAGRGLGLRILRWVEAYAAAHGRNLMRLDTYEDNAALVRFYQRAGYEPFGTRGAHDARVLLLQKELKPHFPLPQ